MTTARSTTRPARRSSRSFPAGNPRVRVRATDDDGRTGETTTTLHVHATNLAPTGALSFNRSNPRVGQAVTVSGYAYDADGLVRRLELDADGNGAYEVSQEFTDAEDAELEHEVTYPSAGARTVRLRITDDGGVMTVATASVDVHAQNLAPVVSLTVSHVGSARRPAGPPQRVRLGRGRHDRQARLRPRRQRQLRDRRRLGRLGDDDVRDRRQPRGRRARDRRRRRDRREPAHARRQGGQRRAHDPDLHVRRPQPVRARVRRRPGSPQYAWDLDGDGVFDDLHRQVRHVRRRCRPTPPARSRSRCASPTTRVRPRPRATSCRCSDQPPSPPSINQSPTQPRAGQSVQFFLSFASSDVARSSGTPTTTGCSSRAPQFGVSKTFPIAGTYPIRARVRDSKGRVATSRHNVTVSPATGNLAPVAYISGYDTARTGVPVTFIRGLSGRRAGLVPTPGSSTATATSTTTLDYAGDGHVRDARRSRGRPAGDRRPGRDRDAVQDDRGAYGEPRAAGHRSAPARRSPARSCCDRARSHVLRRSDRPATIRSSAGRGTSTATAFDDGTGTSKEITFTQTGLHRVRLRGHGLGRPDRHRRAARRRPSRPAQPRAQGRAGPAGGQRPARHVRVPVGDRDRPGRRRADVRVGRGR